MDFRNRYLLHTVRTIFGLLMLASGVFGLLTMNDLSQVPPEMVPITQALIDSGILHMIKITEAVVGLLLVLNLFPALAAIFIAPVAVGIVVVNARLTPAFLPLGLVVCAFTAYLGYAYWPKYRQLFVR